RSCAGTWTGSSRPSRGSSRTSPPMLAYVFWHRPSGAVHQDDYERALARFHHSLAENPPAGFASSVTLRAAELPWLGVADGEPARAPEPGVAATRLPSAWRPLRAAREPLVG